MLGVFNDIPWHTFRETEAHAWARAGFTWVVNDGEHSQWEGYYGREQNEALLRLGILPVQRLPREAVSPHGDALLRGGNSQEVQRRCHGGAVFSRVPAVWVLIKPVFAGRSDDRRFPSDL